MRKVLLFSFVAIALVSACVKTVDVASPGPPGSSTGALPTSDSPMATYSPPAETALPPSPTDTARAVAAQVALSFSGVSYALLTSRDGYVLKCSTPCQQNARQVRFGTTLAISVNGKTPGKTLYKVLKQTVTADNAAALQQGGFDYVLVAFPDRKPGNSTIAFGYSLADWAKWGTSQQPQNPTLALVTNKNEQFKPV